MATTARERARAELTAEILAAARGQLATSGAEQLSLRAVARELELAPSALYRYFASRDQLLTALIVEAYDAVGERAEQAAASARSGLGGRPHRRAWLATCREVRAWAREQPHQFALVYGSPVTGYRAPENTVAPALRVVLLLLGIVRDAEAAGALTSVPRLTGKVSREVTALTRTLGLDDVPPAAVARAVTAWSQLIGLIGLELFGHLTGAFTDDDVFFEHAVAMMADVVGLSAQPADDT